MHTFDDVDGIAIRLAELLGTVGQRPNLEFLQLRAHLSRIALDMPSVQWLAELRELALRRTLLPCWDLS